MTIIYLVATLIFVAAVVFGITRLRRMTPNGLVIGILGGLLFSVLFMIKLRCSIDAYPCGFMSFTGGFTWHLLVGIAIYVGVWILSAIALHLRHSLGIVIWLEILGRSSVPLLGLSIAVVWETLPISVIHPPAFGGPCPSLPIICHDMPVSGFGGLAYWTLPFVLWAAYTAYRDIKLNSRR